MKKLYSIYVKEVYHILFSVEAKSLREAKKKAEDRVDKEEFDAYHIEHIITGKKEV